MNESPRIECVDCGEERARHIVGVSVCKRCWYARTGRAEAVKEQRHHEVPRDSYPEVARNVELMQQLNEIASREKSRGRWWWR